MSFNKNVLQPIDDNQKLFKKANKNKNNHIKTPDPMKLKLEQWREQRKSRDTPRPKKPIFKVGISDVQPNFNESLRAVRDNHNKKREIATISNNNNNNNNNNNMVVNKRQTPSSKRLCSIKDRLQKWKKTPQRGSKLQSYDFYMNKIKEYENQQQYDEAEKLYSKVFHQYYPQQAARSAQFWIQRCHNEENRQNFSKVIELFEQAKMYQAKPFSDIHLALQEFMVRLTNQHNNNNNNNVQESAANDLDISLTISSSDSEEEQNTNYKQLNENNNNNNHNQSYHRDNLINFTPGRIGLLATPLSSALDSRIQLKDCDPNLKMDDNTLKSLSMRLKFSVSPDDKDDHHHHKAKRNNLSNKSNDSVNNKNENIHISTTNITNNNNNKQCKEMSSSNNDIIINHPIQTPEISLKYSQMHTKSDVNLEEESEMLQKEYEKHLNDKLDQNIKDTMNAMESIILRTAKKLTPKKTTSTSNELLEVNDINDDIGPVNLFGTSPTHSDTSISENEMELSPAGSIVILEPVVASKSRADELGTPLFVSPVRRSARRSRIQKKSNVRDILEKHDFAYVPNPAILDANVKSLPKILQSSENTKKIRRKKPNCPLPMYPNTTHFNMRKRSRQVDNTKMEKPLVKRQRGQDTPRPNTRSQSKINLLKL